MADRDDDWANHKGGFQRPPPWGRFPKGQSGNPKGRPKGTGKRDARAKDAGKRLTESEQILDRIADERVEVSRGGNKLRITKKEALRHAQYNLAVKGNGLAMRDLGRDILRVEAKKEALRLADAENAEREAQEKARLDEAWFQHLVTLKKKQAKGWESAEAEGKTEPDEPWPHPDDILIDEFKRTGSVRGPYDAKGVSNWEDSRRLRDHYLARYALALCDERKGEGLVSLIWRMLLCNEDMQLPRRWQVTHKFDIELARYMLMPLRGLRQRVAIGAEEFEKPLPGLRRSRDAYRQQNMLFGPMLKVLGYRSLKQFERACETLASEPV